MRKVFLAINYMALLGALLACPYIAVMVSLQGAMRVTELDRNGVFNEEKLRTYSPQLAQNLRTNVGNWIQEPTRSAAIDCALYLAVLALLNIIGFHHLGSHRKSNDQQSAEGDAPSPAKS